MWETEVGGANVSLGYLVFVPKQNKTTKEK
jgi:hypothetical protein